MEKAAEDLKERQKLNDQLLIASENGLLQDVEILINRGADANSRDKNKMTPILLASARGHLKVVDYLWSKAGDIEAEDPLGRTPLHFAACNGHHSIVASLLSKGAVAVLEDSSLSTPLHYAARQGHDLCVQHLIKYHAQIDLEDQDKLTPLMYSILKGHLAVADVLLKWNTTAKNGGGNSFEGDDRLSVLMNHRVALGFTVLHLVAATGESSSLQWVLDECKRSDRGDDYINDLNNEEGLSPLHCAVSLGRVDNATILLRYGADTGIRNYQGQTPFDLIPSIEKKYPVAALALTHLAKEKNIDVAPKTKSSIKTTTFSPAAAAAAAAAAKTTPTATTATTTNTTMYPMFQKLSNEGKDSIIDRWCSLLKSNDTSSRDKLINHELKEYSPKSKDLIIQHVTHLVALQQGYCTLRALSSLRSDEDFQAFLWEPEVEAAIRSLTQDPSLYETYSDDSRITYVLIKMRAIHHEIKVRGQGRLALCDVMVAKQHFESRKLEDEIAVASLEADMDQTRVIIAVAASVGESVVDIAIDGVMRKRKEGTQGLPSKNDGMRGMAFLTGDGDDHLSKYTNKKLSTADKVLSLKRKMEHAAAAPFTAPIKPPSSTLNDPKQTSEKGSNKSSLAEAQAQLNAGRLQGAVKMSLTYAVVVLFMAYIARRWMLF